MVKEYSKVFQYLLLNETSETVTNIIVCYSFSSLNLFPEDWNCSEIILIIELLKYVYNKITVGVKNEQTTNISLLN